MGTICRAFPRPFGLYAAVPNSRDLGKQQPRRVRTRQNAAGWSPPKPSWSCKQKWGGQRNRINGGYQRFSEEGHVALRTFE